MKRLPNTGAKVRPRRVYTDNPDVRRNVEAGVVLGQIISGEQQCRKQEPTLSVVTSGGHNSRCDDTPYYIVVSRHR